VLPRLGLPLIALVLLAAACGGGSSSKAATMPWFATLQPNVIMTTTVSAARAASTVKTTYRSRQDGYPYSWVTVAGPKAGDQQITVGGQHVEIALYHDTLWFRGSVAGLERAWGFTAAQAQADGGAWFSQKHAAEDHGSEVSQLDHGQWVQWLASISSPEKAGLHTIRGHRTIQINGYDTSGKVTVYVDLALPHRPVEIVTGRSRVFVQGWNVPLYLPAQNGAPI
jgi:hypothetical protein